MNKKVLIGLVLIIALVISGSLIYKSVSNTSSSNPSVENTALTTPTRQAEINGYVLAVEGNELKVANELGLKEVSDEERLARQKLSQEERQALKLQESANLTKENIDVTIPVGTPIVKGKGDASGQNVSASLSDITKGTYVSIWQSGGVIEIVKLKGV